MSVIRSTEVPLYGSSYIWYSIGNSSGPWFSVCLGEVFIIGRVRYWKFHCSVVSMTRPLPSAALDVLHYKHAERRVWPM